MKKKFIFEQESFEGKLQEETTLYKLWQKVSSDRKKKFFLTTAMPSPDQMVIFHKFGERFIFFHSLKEVDGMFEIGVGSFKSHYTHTLPYSTHAHIVPYKLEGKPGRNANIIVDFVASMRHGNIREFNLQIEGRWFKTDVEPL